MKDILDLTEKKDFNPDKFKENRPKTKYSQRRVPWDKNGVDIHNRINRKTWISSAWNSWGSWESLTASDTNTIVVNYEPMITYSTYDPVFGEDVYDIDGTSMHLSEIASMNIFDTYTASISYNTNSTTSNTFKFRLPNYISQQSIVEGVDSYYGMRTGKVSNMKRASAYAYYNRARRGDDYIPRLSKRAFKDDDYSRDHMLKESKQIKDKLKKSLHDCFFDEYYHVGEFRESKDVYCYDYPEVYYMLTDNKPLDHDTFENLVKDDNASERYLYRRSLISRRGGRSLDDIPKKLKMKWFDRYDEYLREMVVGTHPRKQWRGVTERKDTDKTGDTLLSYLNDLTVEHSVIA